MTIIGEAKMHRTIKRIVVWFFLVGLVGMAATVHAGYTLDYGQLPGTPARANYVAWWDSSNPPNQVLTEDGYNTLSGPDQGYQNGFWLLDASNFFPSSPGQGAQIHFVFGGLGNQAGTIWTYTILSHDINDSHTNHGTVGEPASGACPTMLPGSWDGESNKVIRWSAPPGTYLIYKSVNRSGASNDCSNGRYDYLATVTTTGSEGSYTDTNATVQSWNIVIPAGANGVINGCHSEESGPTALALRPTLHVGSDVQKPLAGLALASIILGGCTIAWVWRLQQKRHDQRADTAAR